jgi:hypothetical protein
LGCCPDSYRERRAGVVGLLSLLYDKRASTAAIPNHPEGLLIMFDLKMSGHKKSLLSQAL